MTDGELEAAGWSQELGYWSHPDSPGRLYIRADAVAVYRDGDPAPRPTCGTCPHWDQQYETEKEKLEMWGYCTFSASVKHIDRHDSDWCGQHPDMPAWIRDEWPKVKR